MLSSVVARQSDVAARHRARYKAAAMLQGWQIRAGRAALRWTTRELARRAGLGVSTVWRLEAADGIPAATTTVLRKLVDAFAAAGVTFPDDRTMRYEPPAGGERRKG